MEIAHEQEPERGEEAEALPDEAAPDGTAPRPEPSAIRRVLTKHKFTLLAWLFLGAAVIHPADGMGIPLCPSRFVSGLACPGCGLTRSVSSAARGDLASSWHYHPFGAPILAFVAVVAIVGVLPRSLREPIVRAAHRHRRFLSRGGVVYLCLLVVFGIARMYGLVGNHV